MTRSKQQETESTSNAWIPENPGDTLTGKVVDVDSAWSDYRNANYPLLTIENDDGEHTVHCFHTVLFNEVMKWEPVVGEEVTIVYKGVGKGKPGMSGPKLYKVRIPGRPSASSRGVYGRLRGQAPTQEEVANLELPVDDGDLPELDDDNDPGF